MKNLTPALLFAMTMTTPVEADIERCLAGGLLAEALAENRQNGTLLSTVITRAEMAQETFDQPEKDLQRLKDMAILVYGMTPVYDTEAEKKKAIKAIRDGVELKCFKGLNK